MPQFLLPWQQENLYLAPVSVSIALMLPSFVILSLISWPFFSFFWAKWSRICCGETFFHPQIKHTKFLNSGSGCFRNICFSVFWEVVKVCTSFLSFLQRRLHTHSFLFFLFGEALNSSLWNAFCSIDLLFKSEIESVSCAVIIIGLRKTHFTKI